MNLTVNQRKQLFDKIVTLVQTKYYDPSFGGRDWNAIATANRAQIVDAPDRAAFEAAVAQMLGQLTNGGHFGLLSPTTKITARNSINASFRRVLIGNSTEKWVFQDVLPGGVAERAAIRPGDILIAINGNELDTTSAPAFPMNAKIAVTIDRAGTHHDFQVDLTTKKPKYRSNPYSEPASVTAKMGPSNIGIMTVSLFPGLIGIDFANRVSQLFRTALAGAQRLLIDLRGNPGGGIGGLRIMSYLAPMPTPVGFSVDRKTADRGYRKETLPRLNRIPHSKWEIPIFALKFLNKKSVVLETERLGRQPFHGRVGILVNEHSTSAAEMLAQFAQENRLATIIGTKTPGRLVSRSAFKIGHDYRLVMPIAAYESWNGVRIEGKGIEPEVHADWSFDAALNGEDTQLNKAIETVRSL